MTRKSGSGAIYDLLEKRINRRDVLVGGGVLAVGATVGCTPSEPVRISFVPVVGSAEDSVILPDGFSSEVVIRWGDPVVAGSTAMPMDEIPSGRLFDADISSLQSATFGGAADGMGVIPIDENRLAVCVNHEFPEMSRIFPGWSAAARERKATEFIQEHPAAVATMRAGVGVSVLELERDGSSWRLVSDSPLNRRVTADTPIEFSGPAARHEWVGGNEDEPGRCLGTFGNCAAGSTPWGTYLTAEENTNDFFGNGSEAEWDELLARTADRQGYRRGSSAYRWEVIDERFDLAKNPSELMKFGWIVEIDPLNPERTIKKRTALGRLRHEGATTVLNTENRPVTYMGDDSSFEYFYKFVSNQFYDPDNPGDTDTLLDDGTLYVAKLNEDGSGEWLAMVHGQGGLTEENDFFSQADVVMRCREAADLLGATPLDRPEDVAVHPHDGRVYLACTQGTLRGTERPRPPAEEEAAEQSDATAEPDATTGTAQLADAGDGAEVDAEAESEEDLNYPAPDAANPRGPNPYGHILEFTEDGGDAAAENFRWEVFILAGDPATEGLAAVAIAGRLGPAVAYYAGHSDSTGMSGFACPDNLGFDDAGNLWIVTDGPQPAENNNGCFVCPTDGPERGMVKQFMSGPVGAEISGCTFSPDGQTLFLTVQHPGSGGSIEEPVSHWPDGGDAQPRSSLIAIRTTDSGTRFEV